MASPAKKPRLLPSDDAASPGIAVMLIDVEEDLSGALLLWGLAAEGRDGHSSKHRTVLLRCPDYQPYFFIPCPQVVDPDTQELQEPQQQDLQRLRRMINSRWAQTVAVGQYNFLSTTVLQVPCNPMALQPAQLQQQQHSFIHSTNHSASSRLVHDYLHQPCKTGCCCLFTHM